MHLAAAEAESNLKSMDGGPFGAVVVQNGTVLGKGRNRVLASHDPTAHAEIAAIRDACANLGSHDLTGCVLYTSCYPCPMCLSAAIWANIRTIYYGNTTEDAERIGFRDGHIYDFIRGGCLSSEVLQLTPCCRELTLPAFDAFAASRDSVLY